MAIIKCPECGHEVSDQAPVCPNCGVEIAGKVTECPQCGTVYFKRLTECPFCHYPTGGKAKPTGTPPVPPQASKDDVPQPHKPRRSYVPWIIGFVIALVICGAVGFYYVDAKNGKELEAYEYAMQSQDVDVLQNYLDNYGGANQEHTDSIQNRLSTLKLGEQEWANAVVSGSKAALEAYLNKYPNTSHKIEAIHRIDSIDWNTALTTNTPDAIQRYLDQHSDGEHVDDANAKLQELSSTTVSTEERTAVVGVVRKFFQSINSKNEGGLRASVSDYLTSFLDKPDASSDDVVAFMHKIYKADVQNMNWKLGGDFKIDKKEVGEQQYEYTVQFSASQEVDKTDNTKQNNQYRITAGIGTDGRICSMSMMKIG